MTRRSSLPEPSNPRRPLGIRPVTPTSQVEAIADELRRSILLGLLPPGESFSITELTGALGVSQIPIREALRRLEAEGLVGFRFGRGAIVTPLDITEVRAIYRLRTLVEPPLAAESAPLLTDADLRHAEDLLTVYDRSEELVEEMMEHTEFHMTLLRPAMTPWDRRILELLWNAGEKYSRLMFHPEDRDAQRSLKQRHQHILRAAQSRSPARLQTALHKHLLENEKALIAVIGNDGASTSSSRSKAPGDGLRARAASPRSVIGA